MRYVTPISCPFCGEEPRIKTSGSFDGWNATVQCSNTKCHAYPSVSDEGKGLERTTSNAIELWNKRSFSDDEGDLTYHLNRSKKLAPNEMVKRCIDMIIKEVKILIKKV
jgi:hypothetical protein